MNIWLHEGHENSNSHLLGSLLPLLSFDFFRRWPSQVSLRGGARGMGRGGPPGSMARPLHSRTCPDEGGTSRRVRASLLVSGWSWMDQRQVGRDRTCHPARSQRGCVRTVEVLNTPCRTHRLGFRSVGCSPSSRAGLFVDGEY